MHFPAFRSPLLGVALGFATFALSRAMNSNRMSDGSRPDSERSVRLPRRQLVDSADKIVRRRIEILRPPVGRRDKKPARFLRIVGSTVCEPGIAR
jgi:hypothetical protein